MKTTTKKLLAALALVVLMLGMLPLNISHAANKPNVTVNSVDAKVGEEVTVNLKLDQKVTAASFATTVKFDKTKLEVTNVEVVSLSNVLDKPTVENSNAQGEVMFMAISAVNFDTEAGTLGKITFRVKEGAAGKQNLTVEVNEVMSVNAQYEVSDITDTVTATSGAINVIVPVESVTLDKTKGTLNVGETADLVATVKPANATQDKTVTWTTSDATVATVKDGTVTAVAPGTATITATAAGKKATYTVEVKAPLTGIKLNSTSENLLKGQSFDLKVEYIPSNTTDNRDVTWTTSDATVATVKDGTVTALKEGTTVITATVGKVSAACAINVTEVKLESIEINSKDFELLQGDSKELSVLYNPDNTTDNKNVTWTTSDEKVVKVENGKVTALKVGTATITAKVGNKEASVKVTVPEVLVEGIELTVDNARIEVEGTANLKVTTNPVKVTEEVKVVYVSSDETVATVDKNGVVKGLKPGKATITVTVNEKFEKEVEIEVTEKVVVEDDTNTEKEEEKETSVLPNTGDIAVGIFAVLMIVSLAGIVLAVKNKKK